MKYNESNFTYLKLTTLNKYYQYLLKAECACEDFPKMTKIIARRVVDAFVRELSISYGINSNIATGQMVKMLRYNEEFSIPEEIYDYIQIIRVNGIGITLYRSREKRIEKHPIEILELIHRIFCWYLRIKETETISKFIDLSFKAPKTIEFEKNELRKIKRDIQLKNNQINNLREKIIELAMNSKSVGELNRIIIAIKQEKEELEKQESFFTEVINSHKYEIEEVHKIYEREIREVDLVKDECVENHRLLAKKESLLVRAELDKQQIRSTIDNLEEDEDIINKRKDNIEKQLESIRLSYEKSLGLTNRYQDESETIIFTYDENLKKLLSNDKSEIISELNFEDSKFYNKITEYNKLIEDTKKKITLFKGILDDRIRHLVKYDDFYNAFLNLNGNKLRILYSMVSNWNKNNSNILSKSKEWLLNRSNEESLLDMVNKTLEEIKSLSDDQIKLSLYYKVLRISGVQIKNICNRKNFIKAVDSMVQSAYVTLLENKDFNYYLSKTHSIKVCYMKKVIEKLKSRYKNIKIKDELVYRIYDEIVKISFKNEVYFTESLKIDVKNEHALKNSIKKQPFDFLSIIIEVGEEADYKFVYGIIFEILKDITVNNYNTTGEQLSLEKFLTGSFRIMLFISSNDVLNSRDLEEVIVLFVGEVLISDSIINYDKIDFDSYNRMIEVWKSKQIFYKDKLNEKNDIDNELEAIVDEKLNLESNIEALNSEEKTLKQKYASYEEEFKHMVFSSEKSNVLESYGKYKEFKSKMQESRSSNNISSESSIIETWVEQASKMINESNLAQSEIKLIEEAKKSGFFERELKVFTDLQEWLKDIENDLYNNRKILREKEEEFSLMKSKAEKLSEYLDTLKEIYPDIE